MHSRNTQSIIICATALEIILLLVYIGDYLLSNDYNPGGKFPLGGDWIILYAITHISLSCLYAQKGGSGVIIMSIWVTSLVAMATILTTG
jgi:hypothetical protein